MRRIMFTVGDRCSAVDAREEGKKIYALMEDAAKRELLRLAGEVTVLERDIRELSKLSPQECLGYALDAVKTVAGARQEAGAREEDGGSHSIWGLMGSDGKKEAGFMASDDMCAAALFSLSSAFKGNSVYLCVMSRGGASTYGSGAIGCALLHAHGGRMEQALLDAAPQDHVSLCAAAPSLCMGTAMKVGKQEIDAAESLLYPVPCATAGARAVGAFRVEMEGFTGIPPVSRDEVLGAVVGAAGDHGRRKDLLIDALSASPYLAGIIRNSADKDSPLFKGAFKEFHMPD